MSDKENTTPFTHVRVTDEMVAWARKAYRKQTSAEEYQLDGWIDDALRASLEAAFTYEELISSYPSEVEKLRSALAAAVYTIQDYLAYNHDGDPWTEDSRAMGEMDINDYGRDGRLDYALRLLAFGDRIS